MFSTNIDTFQHIILNLKYGDTFVIQSKQGANIIKTNIILQSGVIQTLRNASKGSNQCYSPYIFVLLHGQKACKGREG